MYDESTAKLIRSAPELDGLNLEKLPDFLTETFAQIVAARIRLRGSDVQDTEDLSRLIKKVKRLAYTNESLVALLPEREDRASTAFVAATAHQLCFSSDVLLGLAPSKSQLNADSISSDISAMLLFMVAEATADASEVSKSIIAENCSGIEGALIESLRDLAKGKLLHLVAREIPEIGRGEFGDLAKIAVQALYLTILKGVHLLAQQMLSVDSADEFDDPTLIFKQIADHSIGREESISLEGRELFVGGFSGPAHLASLLISVSTDLLDCAVTRIPKPRQISRRKWNESIERIASSRPYLWRNHRSAIEQGYLKRGTSSVIGFPTGAGKSTLAELKINTALLTGRAVVFLAPTHALVDQTSNSLKQAFPSASVQRERQDGVGLALGDDNLPEVFVMTPESCLMQISIDPEIFVEVGLVVFDECHLLHPSEQVNDRRAIDAMLCILSLSKLANRADFLLLSAMMRNTDDISEWIAELTDRPCLSLSLPWKPTRQLRGSVVYQQERVTELNDELMAAQKNAKTKGPSAKLKRSLAAKPFALFSMKQTWETNNRNDYGLVGLLNEPIILGSSQYWRLTPNAVVVSSSIAATSAHAGIKSLVFFQTIKNAASAARQVSERLLPVSISLSKDEAIWLEIATKELGDASHLYIEVENGKVTKSATVHHGLLLPEERYLCESLYKRPDGIKVLTATSTLAQGMNLPSELVIIGEDSRFDQDTDKREILKAQELLNAAGRAGRAGENASGIVLVVPGKVVGIDIAASKIGPHWADLRKIFGQSDQCLDIDDPLVDVFDRIHESMNDVSEIDQYTILRLASCGVEGSQSEALSQSINSSFGAFLARKRADDEWVHERIRATSAFLNTQPAVTENELILSQISASLGLSLVLVSRLWSDLKKAGPPVGATIPKWRKWFFRWLTENPDLLELICRKQSLIELFGKSYDSLETEREKAAYAIPRLRKLTWRWMRGDVLSELEMELGVASDKLKTCNGARRFVIRVIPELSYLFSLPALLFQREQLGLGVTTSISSSIAQLGRCVRLGLNSYKKAALNQIRARDRLSRCQLHESYELIESHIPTGSASETWEETLTRIKIAIKKERDD